ncbi:hypothetical protein [Serratia phage SP1]|nr:hypothetical protein [Serratia phage SP1]
MKQYKSEIAKNEAIFIEHPGVIIIERKPVDGFIEITSSDKLTFTDYKLLGEWAAMDSAEYYRENGFPEDQIEKRLIEDQQTWGTSQYSIFGLGSCITSHKQAKSILLKLSFGDKVKFAGKCFTVEKDFNRNAKLVEI